MNVRIVKEKGYETALLGLGLSYDLTTGDCNSIYDKPEIFRKLETIAEKLAFKGGGENKFLRQIVVWLDITAPRYFWEQMATYKVGTCFQSQSTMHTLTKTELTLDMFETKNMTESGINELQDQIHLLKDWIRLYNCKEDEVEKEMIWYDIISLLPQSFLQRRIATVNYAVLQNMIDKRRNHKLEEWKYFCRTICSNVIHPELLIPPTIHIDINKG